MEIENENFEIENNFLKNNYFENLNFELQNQIKLIYLNFIYPFEFFKRMKLGIEQT